ncbi:MAG: hypothetical protein KF855_05870 [Acidobacteria bacterium]|nr:hypothetical protein [Acidobacteriota bacterium]
MSKDKPPTPPSSGGGGSPAGGTAETCCPSDFKISPCRIMKVNGRLQISASELEGFPGGTYEWTTSSSKVTLENPKSGTVTVKAGADPGSGRDSETINVTRKAPGCAPVTKAVKVTVAKVTFSASPNQRYGYDDFDTPANPDDDHICVKKSDHTFVKVKIEGGAVGTDFDWACDDAGTCDVVQPGGTADFDLRLNAGAHNKRETTLKAKSKCPGAEVFAQLKVHVYKERVVNVSIAKFDKTDAGTNMRFPTADYASHQNAANDKLKQGVVKYNLSNYDANNKPTPVNLASGTSTLTYDIKAGGGADLTAISSAMTGTGNKVRVAIIRDMKSVYYLAAAASAGDTSVTVTAGSTFLQTGRSYALGTGATRENISVTALNGGTITCAALTHDHAAGETIEFPAAGWSSDPILIIEGNASLDVAKWTILHEVGHRAEGLGLRDIIDRTNFMHFSQDWTDYRLRYCPRLKNYPAGTTDKENQWELIPRT